MYLLIRGLMTTAFFGVFWLINPGGNQPVHRTKGTIPKMVEKELAQLDRVQKVATLYSLASKIREVHHPNSMVLAANSNDSLISEWIRNKAKYGNPLYLMGHSYLPKDSILAMGHRLENESLWVGTPQHRSKVTYQDSRHLPWVLFAEGTPPMRPTLLTSPEPTFIPPNPDFSGFGYSVLHPEAFNLKSALRSRLWIAKGDSLVWITLIHKALQKRILSEKQLDNKLATLMILDRKRTQRAYFSNSKKQSVRVLEKKVRAGSLTLLNNQDTSIPLATSVIPYQLWTIGNQGLPGFTQVAGRYNGVISAHLPDLTGISPQKLMPRNMPTIIAISDLNLDPKRHRKFLRWVRKHPQLVIANFGTPHNLVHIPSHVPVVQGYDSHLQTQEMAAQVLFGGMKASGKLPMHVSTHYHLGAGEDQANATRLGYAIPEEVGLSSLRLGKIVPIVEEAIKDTVMPGCQVLVARKGKVVFHRSFGHHTYEKEAPVTLNDIYDLASITKVASTTLAAMRQYEKGDLYLNSRIGFYLDDTASTPFNKILVQELLLHQSGLEAYMPVVPFLHYRDSVTGRFDKYYQPRETGKYTVQVADEFYMREDYPDSLRLSIRKLEVSDEKAYMYSDINFNILQEILEKKTGMSLDQYAGLTFFEPMGLSQMGYRPLERVGKSYIVPTEKDRFWRKQLLRGQVHDPAAALLGGVAGSAGLFGNSYELAALFQMLLNKGTYGGHQYLKPSTVSRFTKTQEGSHRGLGFNKATGKEGGPCPPVVSTSTFGHRGFTGTCVWADPVNEIIYIFLSNRVHPDPDNTKIRQLKVRERIHEAVYAAITRNPA